ncbi:MAG: hypothetical protein L6Q54_06270 [Leptospiraceae bacterium]|nr:hypothetical protein [Leptospiraceae bacterium]MCK6380841.1 hypothetical protein [Leptospiraceae bacterium]
MNDAIGYVLTNYYEWDMTLMERKAIKSATDYSITDDERIGRVCDLLATFGIQDKPEFDMFFQFVRDEPEEYSSAASFLGKKGGSVISLIKAKTSRENGKKGGRPKKKND